MDAIIQKLKNLIPEGFDMDRFTYFAVAVLIVTLLVSLLGRLFFGKKATLTHAVSCAIAILGIYIINIVVISTNSELSFLLSPLPFVSISGDYLHLFNILNSDINSICTEVLNLVILAFLMNILESILPKGKKLLSWYAFRFLSVVLAICLHYVVNLLLAVVVPEGLAQIAPTVLIIVLLAALALGALKIFIGGVLTVIDPLLGILYTFFFTNIIGRQLNRAVITTGILTGIVCLVNYLGITSVFIAVGALIAYIPFLLIMLVLWYIVGHLM